MDERPLWGRWTGARRDPGRGRLLLAQTALDFAFPQAVVFPRSPLSVLLITSFFPANSFVPPLLPGAAPGQRAGSVSLSPTFPGMLPVGASRARDGRAAPAQLLLGRCELGNTCSFPSTAA